MSYIVFSVEYKKRLSRMKNRAERYGWMGSTIHTPLCTTGDCPWTRRTFLQRPILKPRQDSSQIAHWTMTDIIIFFNVRNPSVIVPREIHDDVSCRWRISSLWNLLTILSNQRYDRFTTILDWIPVSTVWLSNVSTEKLSPSNLFSSGQKATLLICLFNLSNKSRCNGGDLR